MGKQCVLKQLDCWYQTNWFTVSLKLMISWDFNAQWSAEFYSEWCHNKRKHAVSSSFVDGNAMLIWERSEESGQTGWSWQWVTQITTLPEFPSLDSIKFICLSLWLWWGGPAKTVEDHAGSYPVNQKEKKKSEAKLDTGSPKLTEFGLMGLEFCWGCRCNGQKFPLTAKNPWTRPALCQQPWSLVVVQSCGEGFPRTLDPLILTSQR